MKPTTRAATNAACFATACIGSACAPIRVATSTEIDRPVETTWRMFADADRLGEWMHDSWDRRSMHWADVQESEIGVPRLVRLGDDGKEMELTQTIIAVEVNEEFRYSFEHEWADTEFTFLFEATGPEACAVRCEFTAQPKGLHGIWMNAARRSIENRFNKHLAGLRAMVESAPGEQR